MRKYFLIFIIISSFLYGQDKKVSELTEKTTLSDSYNILLIEDGVGNYKASLANTALFMFNADRVINGNFSFTYSFQLAATPTAGKVRGLSYSTSDRPAYTDNSGVVHIIPNMDDLTAAGLGDTSNFANILVANAFSATQAFNAGLSALGSVDLSGANELILPFTPTTAAEGQIFYANDEVYFTNGNTTYVRLAKASEVGSGAYLTQTGTLTSLASALYWTSNGIRYVATATGASNSNVKAGLPVYSTKPAASAMYNGDVFRVNGETDTDGSGAAKLGMYFVYTDQDYNRYLGFLPDINKVNRLISETLNYDAPIAQNSATDTLDFSTTAAIAGIYGAQGAQTVTITNYRSRIINCIVESDAGVTFDFGAVAIEWADGITPTFTDSKNNLVTFIYKNSSTVLGSYVTYE